jgi:hypothetical protein
MTNPGYSLFLHLASRGALLKSFHCNVQEIKFEPIVMCEVIDQKLTFRSSQVCQCASIQRSCLDGVTY